MGHVRDIPRNKGEKKVAGTLLYDMYGALHIVKICRTKTYRYRELDTILLYKIVLHLPHIENIIQFKDKINYPHVVMYTDNKSSKCGTHPQKAHILPKKK